MHFQELEKFLSDFKTHPSSSPSESWDSYFMGLAYRVRERSSCHHRQVGALVVRENRILATGYNQPPSGFPHCDQTECIRDALKIESGQNQEICYAAHAEQNAISQAARFGISTNGSTIYVTHRPCSICARLIVNAGIKRVVFAEGYPDPLTKFMFDRTGVATTHFTL